MGVNIQAVLERKRSKTLGEGREDYLNNIHTGKAAGSTQIVPTGAYGKINMCVMHFGWDLNHCNMHLKALADLTKLEIEKIESLHGNLASVPGISDGQANGSPAMRHSLASRDHMTVNITNHYTGTPYHGLVLIPGCDKNMPSAAMSLFYLNEPGFIICGGSIRPGENNTDIVSVYQAKGSADKGEISEEEYADIHKNACPGPGACGGMYTANSMFTIFEAMGLTPLFNSSTMAEDKLEGEGFVDIPNLTEDIVNNHRTPEQYITKASFENAVRILCVLGGSTNPVLHLLAMAQATKNWDNPIDFTEADIERISSETPFIGNLAPNGKHRMQALSDNGGTPTVLRYMLENGHLDGSQKTLTGQTLEEQLKGMDDEKYQENLQSLFDKEILRPFDNPLLDRGHLVHLDGNMGAGWTKVSNAGLEKFEGTAAVFESEKEFLEVFKEASDLQQQMKADKVPDDEKEKKTLEFFASKGIGEGAMVVIRNTGPKGAPGMPEMLTATSKIVGAFGMSMRIGLMTDGRFSGGSVGGAPIIGHMDEDGSIRLIQDGDKIIVDPKTNSMKLDISDADMKIRESQYEVRQRVEEHVPMSLREYAKGNPDPRTGSVSIEF